MPSTALALTPALPSELLTYILAVYSHPVTLIICQSRVEFLNSLLQCLSPPIPPQPPPPAEDGPDRPATPLPEDPPRHSLLLPTIHQVLASRNIELVFVTSVSALRAYLAVFPSNKQKAELPLQVFDKPGKQDGGLLVVYGLVGLHKDTSEWSAQGLGYSIAMLVEAGHRNMRNVVLVEERRIDEGRDNDECNEEHAELHAKQKRRRWALRLWNEEVPVLSGGGGRKVMEGGWSGRTVEVGRIMGRWCRFGRGEWDN